MNDTVFIVDRTIPRSYWVERGRVLAGEYPGSLNEREARSKIDRLLHAGVTWFLDLTEEHDTIELKPYAQFLTTETSASGHMVGHRRMPIRDACAPSTEEMRAILDAIDAATSDGHVVYFHCWGGHGRTGTVAGCYMVRHGSTPQDALDAIKRLREGSLTAHRASPERGAQTEMVLNWQELDERTASPDGR
jgi:protein-tyrosine phosphatase